MSCSSDGFTLREINFYACYLILIQSWWLWCIFLRMWWLWTAKYLKQSKLRQIACLTPWRGSNGIQIFWNYVSSFQWGVRLKLKRNFFILNSIFVSKLQFRASKILAWQLTVPQPKIPTLLPPTITLHSLNNFLFIIENSQHFTIKEIKKLN